MKRRVLIICLLISILQFSGIAQWKPAGDKIRSVWTEKLDPANVLPEYPRPVMERPQWQNLNGLWDYAITPLTDARPYDFNGKTFVPFAVESSLSGVQKRVNDEQILWYHRSFNIPKTWNNKKVLLHFGAVDWKTEVWINDIRIGSYEGGYTPFSFDITPFQNSKGSQQIIVKVWDPTKKGPQPIGRQWTTHRSDCFYTPVTGIWQTVWIGPVNDLYISSIKTTPDIDNNTIRQGLTDIRLIAREIEKYNKPYPKGQWDWKNDRQMALQYYNKIAIEGWPEYGGIVFQEIE